MPTVNETIKALQEIVALNPKFGEFETIYATDDEGNEYNKVISIPCLAKVVDIEQNNYLEIIDFHNIDEKPSFLERCNCVIIN